LLDLLRSEIRRGIETYCEEPTHREAVLRALSRPDYALHPESRCRASLLTLEVYQSICGKPGSTALQAAAAMELYMEAAFMFDNVADNEVDPDSGLSAAEDLALAITLMLCGAAVAYEAGEQAKNEGLSLNPLLQLSRDCISSCSGQFLDARLKRQGQATTDEALNMTCFKCGSLGRSATVLGAGIATDDAEIINLFGEFGHSLFIYFQLVDDLRDACPADGSPGDLAQGTQTLPLAYFNNYMSEVPLRANDGIIPSQLNLVYSPDISRLFKESGAEVFCAIIAETFLNRAKSNLAVLKNRAIKVEGLEKLVNSIEIEAQEILAVV